MLFLDKVFAFSFFLCYTLYGDYMKSRGFTLVELLGVVFILALLGLLIVPIVSNVLIDKKNDLYNVQIRNIEDGLSNYLNEHFLDVNVPSDSWLGYKLEYLQELGYIKNGIKNPITNREFSSDMVIAVKNSYDGFEYHFGSIFQDLEEINNYHDCIVCSSNNECIDVYVYWGD